MQVNLSKRNIELFQDLIKIEIYNSDKDGLLGAKEYKKYLKNILANLENYVSQDKRKDKIK